MTVLFYLSGAILMTFEIKNYEIKISFCTICLLYEVFCTFEMQSLFFFSSQLSIAKNLTSRGRYKFELKPLPLCYLVQEFRKLLFVFEIQNFLFKCQFV